ncbi:nucleotidyltransferase domain-containing protein [Phytomonospora sp. NPDC050363]|uniref:nucleotidyltransferase domain-containing protein n=1 Tax=Phytomonospora sp. NPDC050363 TaxID=3155642 RepID=UPI0033D78AA3
MDPHRLVEEHTVYACVVGSRAYGLAREGSDVDRRGVYLAPTPLYWRFDKPPTHVDGPGEERFSWELERCCELALVANPTVLECLWSPVVERVTPVGERLLAIRRAFLSTRVAQTFGSYSLAQFHRLTARRERDGTVKWKQAMHMLRLLRAGAHVLATGEVLVDVGDEREQLLAVRDGLVDWDEVVAWMERLRGELETAAEATRLPAEPDRDAVEAFLVEARAESARVDV